MRAHKPLIFGFLLTALPTLSHAAEGERFTVQALSNFGLAKTNDFEEWGRHEGYAIQGGYQKWAGEFSCWTLALELGQGTSHLKQMRTYAYLTSPSSQPSTAVYASKATLETNWSLLARAGYGLRLGENSLASVSLGLGQASATFDVEYADTQPTSRGTLFSIDLEGQFSLTKSFFITVGMSQRGVKYSFDQVDPRVDDAFQLNTATLSVGALAAL